MVSIWEKETFFAPQDVIILGSGFVGLWSAFYLKKKHPKRKITLLERGFIPTGASTRNAGFACFGSLSEVVYDAKTNGSDAMLRLVEMRFKGLEKIKKYFDKNDIDFDICGGYELYDNSDKVSSDQLMHNIEYINSLLKPITDNKRTYRLVDDQIRDFQFGNTSHMIKNNHEGYLHSGKLLEKLLHTVQGLGVQVFNLTECTGFESSTDKITIHTNHEVSFQTSQLLICTNAYAKALLPEEDIVPARGQVLVTSPIDNLPWKGTFHSDEGFYYFRNLNNRVLLGGARNKAFEKEQTYEMETSEFIQFELERYLKEVVLPGNAGYS